MRTVIHISALVVGGLLLISACRAAQEPGTVSRVEITYAVGADLSFLKAAEDRGVQFKDIFRDHGYDWIRLRLFHTPALQRSIMRGPKDH